MQTKYRVNNISKKRNLQPTIYGKCFFSGFQFLKDTINAFDITNNRQLTL